MTKRVHEELVYECTRYFSGIGYNTRVGKLMIYDMVVYPDVIISRPSDGITDIPVECGNISSYKHPLYIRIFGMYYHCTFSGNIYKVIMLHYGKILIATVNTWYYDDKKVKINA